jgi:hypothetical protein
MAGFHEHLVLKVVETNSKRDGGLRPPVRPRDVASRPQTPCKGVAVVVSWAATTEHGTVRDTDRSVDMQSD